MSAEIISLGGRRAQLSASEWHAQECDRIEGLLSAALREFVSGDLNGACHAAREAANACSDIIIGRGPDEGARARAATERRRRHTRRRKPSRRKREERLLND